MKKWLLLISSSVIILLLSILRTNNINNVHFLDQNKPVLQKCSVGSSWPVIDYQVITSIEEKIKK